MSLKDLKNEFEKQFNTRLKDMFVGRKDVKVGKNKITIKKGEFIASVDYTWLNNLNACGTVIVVRSPDLKYQLNAFNPPYKSNLPNAEYIYCISTMGEKDGCPLLPTTPEGIDKTCGLLLNRLKDVHLPVIFNLLDLNENLISDVINAPKFYSFPFLIIILAMKENNIPKEGVDESVIMHEQTLGFSNDKIVKMEFNKELFRQYSN